VESLLLVTAARNHPLHELRPAFGDARHVPSGNAAQQPG
jgi:hypothetical protein